jgi:malonyl-CoA O-methyltransferase
MVDGGGEGFGPRYSGTIPETVHLYALPPLYAAAEVLGNPQYRALARRCLDFYSAHPDALRVETLTHFLAYELEALIDVGRSELAVPVLNGIRALQEGQGAVRGAGGMSWVCSPGLAQLAICWYKTRDPEPADRALAWLEAHQQPGGGFLGSYGPGATYFPHVELSWAAKFYLDAHLLRLETFFDRHAALFPSQVARVDGRAQAVLSAVNPGDRVLEVGCGKGRFLKLVREAHPDCECVGVDISRELLRHLPEGVDPIRGSLEQIPSADHRFDVVFSVEAIEHSLNPSAAVREMIRVARPGGWVLIIDKQRAHWGRLRCPSWERWPEITEMRSLLELFCEDVSATPVSYDGRPDSDALMVVWRGRKRV